MRLQPLLVDHPAVPVARPAPHGLELDLPPPAPVTALGRVARLAAAVQLLAAAQLLSTLDLWPTRRALLDARVVRRNGGVSAVLGGLPVSLSLVQDRLGGGEEAMRRTRDAAMEAIRRRLGLPADLFAVPGGRDWLTFDPLLQSLLQRLDRPLPAATARSLWAVRLELPELPAAGEVGYFSVADAVIARRLAAAAVRRWRGMGLEGRWRETGDGPGGRLLDGAAEDFLVVAGSPSAADLLAVERAVEDGSMGRAVVLGRFPLGWSPPAPVLVDGDHLERHLVVAGVPAERARAEVVRRRRRFDPLVEADREALTAAAAVLFERPAGAGGPAAAQDDPVTRVLRLWPSGVSGELGAELTGLAARDFVRRVQAAGGVRADGRWRLAAPSPMVRDPLHAVLARRLGDGEPRRLLHEVLGGADASRLAAWARERLDGLDGGAVRSLLAPVEPSALPPEVLSVWAEACLADLDLACARRVLEELDGELRTPLEGWLEAVDRPWGRRVEPPDERMAATAPRAAAEITLRLLEAGRRRSAKERRELVRLLEDCAGRLRGALRSSLMLEAALAADPGLAGDRSWRRAAAGEDPRLRRVLFRRAAVILMEGGRPELAARALELLARHESRPGWAGLLQLDLGWLALARGEARAADAANFRAYRLLEAAGFRHRTRLVLFNLAVSDVDSLAVHRARRRFERAGEAGDPVLAAELVRLELARGDEAAFKEGLHRLPADGEAEAAGIAEAVSFLRGAGALLTGDRRGAATMLAAGGQEGETWLALMASLEGRAPGDVPSDDGWGVMRCARMIHAAGAGLDPLRAARCGASAPELRCAFAAALAERLLGPQPWIDPRWRREAVRVLASAGLEGWSAVLDAGRAPLDRFLAAARRLIEDGDPARLGEDEVRSLLHGAGVTGLEVRSPVDGRILVRMGDGRPGRRAGAGAVDVIPLGPDPADGEAWRFLAALLPLVVDVSAAPGTGTDAGTTGLYGDSDAMRRLRKDLRRLAPTRLPVLLLGETGTGKEVAARAVHRLSGRKGRLVAVNMAALPPHLVEAELFGSVRGAFTGADRSRRGLVAAADGGTLFLDEIGDLDLALQAKLLRFLESGEVRAVGADRAQTVDVRIVAATHKDLEAQMREGHFRPDLYYRISSATVRIPPLRERAEDIPILRSLFADLAVAGDGLSPARWSREAEEILMRYGWPGNVRELKHVVNVALVRAQGGVVRAEHLPIAASRDLVPARTTYEAALADFRRRFFSAALERNRGNRSATARELGISRQALLYHIRALGLGGPG